MARTKRTKKSPTLKAKPKKGYWGLEGARQLMHISVGLGCFAVLALTSLRVFQNFLLGLLFVGLIISLVARTKRFPMLSRVLSLVERPGEHVPGQGAFLFLVGVGFPAFVIPNAFAVMVGIVALTFQDSVATLVGMRFGRTRLLPGKTVEGFAGGFFACAVALTTLLPLHQAIIVSFVVSIVELFPIEDAVSIPFAAALLAHFRFFV